MIMNWREMRSAVEWVIRSVRGIDFNASEGITSEAVTTEISNCRDYNDGHGGDGGSQRCEVDLAVG